MKTRPVCAAVVSIGTALLLLAGIRCAQAQEIKIVSPGAYEDIEGEGSVGDADSVAPLRFQQVFPAEDFAALGNQPHWIVGFTLRPDESLTSPRTVHWPDLEVRLSTMPVGPPNLSLSFDDNLGADVMQFYRGPQNLVADAQGPGPVPREFYNADRPAGVTPYLYDPSQGNLLFDSIAWQGNSPSARGDKVPDMQTALYAFNPLIEEGIRDAASIFQFTFVPVTPGDYNGDGVVDGDDLANWKAGFGTTGNATRTQGDADGDLDVDGADFLEWQRQVGGGPNSTGAAIPEPSTALIVFVGSLALAARCRPSHVSLRR